MRILLVSLLAALPILAGGWLWLRNSSIVAVREVRISGVHGVDAQAIEETLTRAAQKMSTLDVHPAALIAAVAPGAKPRRDWLAALLAAFAVLCLVGVATHIGDNIGRICGILTPGFAALAAQALQSREDTRPLPRQA